ncbi:MAG: BamA/TamA family outer membrane protein [Candidatus Poribacteria bacterium]|nr:BamA/TamA family outer membrane protein [Candidatus Poribacteria bacterium]
MYRFCSNYTLTVWNWLILTLCCFLLQPVEANEPTEISRDTRKSGETTPSLSGEPKRKHIAKIEYTINGNPIEETTEHLNIRRSQTVVYAGDRLSRSAIQQSIKVLYTTEQYSQIRVYSQDTPDGIILTYDLTPFARIKEIVLFGIPENEFKNTIKNAMRSKPGGRYVPTIAKTDTNRIERVCQEYGYFDAEVTVADALTEDGTLTYQIIAGDASIIKILQIQGNTAISTNRLKEVCNFSRLSPIYNQSNVEADVASMLDLYHKSSYPTAMITPIFVHETGILQFHINEGKHVQLRFVPNIGELPLLLEDAFRKDITPLINTASPSMWEGRIKSYFKTEGYHDTTVAEEASDEFSVRLTINPGTRYVVKSIAFSGNRAFSDAKLLREMTTKPIAGFLRNLQANLSRILFRREQNRFFYQQELDTDVDRLEILYTRAGYPKASIKTTLDKKSADNLDIGEVMIHLIIAEERKEIIHRCDITGNEALDTTILLERLQIELPLPQPNASPARQTYGRAILKAYHEHGYIDAVVSGRYIPDSEVPVFRVAGNFSDSLDARRLPLEVRRRFKEHNLTLSGVDIATRIGNRWSIQDIEGNPRYTLKQEATHLEVFEHGVLRLTVDEEGEQVVFGKFYFEGDTDIVKRHVLEREVAHLEGTLWTAKKLSTALQNLYGLGIFHSVKDERFLQPTRSTEMPRPGKINDVSITVEKQNPRTYSLSSGYSFAEGFRGTLALTDSNFLFKRNIRGRVRGRLGWRDELGYLFDATLTEPWLIGRTRGSLQVLAKKLEVDDNVRALQGSFIFSRDLFKSHHLDLRYSYRDLDQPVPPMPGTPEAIRFPEAQNPFSTTVSSVQLSWTYGSRGRYLNPTDGMFNALTLEYAGGFLQGETGFIKATTDTQYYQKLVGPFSAAGGDSGLVLATALRLGITTGLHSSRRAELISFERFWAGGGTTVRGYAERSLGPKDSAGIHRGDVQFIFNTELRFPIYWWVRGALFFDVGNVWNSLEDINTTAQLPSSVGAGLYLDLGALTVGIDYAIPLVSVPGALDRYRAFHLRLGSPF